MKSEFYLLPKFCLFNNVAIAEQNDTSIKFLIEDLDNEVLKNSLRKSFKKHLQDVNGASLNSDGSVFEPTVYFVKSSREEIRAQISKLFGIHKIENIATGEKLENHAAVKLSQNANTNSNTNPENDSAAEILLNTIISDARKKNATDIHIEKNIVKFRVCGKLIVVTQLQEERCRELIQRIKFLAHMNVLENRKSQDGQFIYGEKNEVYVRVSCISIVGMKASFRSESVVLRLLDPERVPLSIDKLGLHKEQCENLKTLYSQPNGLVLICGATGSGKSTTAAAILLEIQKETSGGKKIISIEDPPEYILPGITQIKIEQSGESEFASALVRIFRQDPDVIFIGEIRDRESARTAVQAALTGHLVFATLHTSDAATAVFRMCDFGIDRAIFLSVLRGVISQSLFYENGEPFLVADVACARDELKNIATEKATSDEIEKGFDHCSNSISFVRKTLERYPLPAWKKSLRVPSKIGA